MPFTRSVPARVSLPVMLRRHAPLERSSLYINIVIPVRKRVDCMDAEVRARHGAVAESRPWKPGRREP